MLRLILLVIMVILFAIIMLPVMILWLIIRDRGNHLVHRIIQAMMKGAAWLYMKLTGVRLKAEGLENIPECPALYVSNHTGIFDIAVAYVTVNNLLSFIGKKETRKIPVIAQVMMMMNGLFLDREDIRQGLKVVTDAMDHIKNGLSVWVCPEGTREKTGAPEDLLPFHGGCFKIAAKTGAPVVPVTIIGSRAIFEDHKPWLSGGDIKVNFGRPVTIAELSDADRHHLGDYFRNLMIDMIKEDK